MRGWPVSKTLCPRAVEAVFRSLTGPVCSCSGRGRRRASGDRSTSKGSLRFDAASSALSLSLLFPIILTLKRHDALTDAMLAAALVASLAAVASFSTSASAQSLTDIPTCAVTCLTQVLPSSP